jgi:uncharacterized protein DUF4105
VSLIFRGIIFAVLVAIIAILSIWSALALYHRLPTIELLQVGAGIAAILFGLGVIVTLFTENRKRGLAVFTAFIALIGVWWSTITPSATGNWSPEVARQVTGEIDGDTLTLTNVREFQWQSKTDYTEKWATRQYDISTVQSLDMLLSYWAGPEIAHFMMSFGFEDGRYLTWSVEVRRQVGGEFSAIGDFFKSNTLAIVASQEQDIVGLRTNIRGEQVYIYRLNTPPENAQKLLREYVLDANALAQKPEFFNSLTSNCTTTVFKLMKAVGSTYPVDWRLIANGYLPEYASERGVLDNDFTLDELREFGHINARANAAGLNGLYSAAIRVGVPPQQ